MGRCLVDSYFGGHCLEMLLIKRTNFVHGNQKLRVEEKSITIFISANLAIITKYEEIISMPRIAKCTSNIIDF